MGAARKALAWLKDLFSGVEAEAPPPRPMPGAAGARPIGATADRELARVAGVIRSIAIGPRGPAAVFEVELVDSTGCLRLIWLGQRQILGLDPGRSLICEGRVAFEAGQRVMRNPRYELVPVGTAA
ncbi:MAG: OB-fold nucleic acid binding domain-containing protein [Bifidobacteriaceae bacterium]|jgi:hypothetical protein|nr:OB-fold nucleic acid binding domain-containing protein [Bifidobacteriaceae bacterium]